MHPDGLTAMTAYTREYPRFQTDLLVKVALEDGRVFHLTCTNISRAGIQLICDGPAVPMLTNGQAERGGIVHDVVDHIVIPLKWAGQEAVEIEVDC